MYGKNQIQGVRELGKRILDFQITWTLVTYGFAYLSIFNGRIQINPFTMLSLMLVLFAGNTTLIILTHENNS